MDARKVFVNKIKLENPYSDQFECSNMERTLVLPNTTYAQSLKVSPDCNERHSENSNIQASPYKSYVFFLLDHSHSGMSFRNLFQYFEKVRTSQLPSLFSRT